MDTVESLNRGQRMFMEAEQYGWGITEGAIPALMGPIMEEHMRKGLKLQFILPESRLPLEPTSPSSPAIKNMQVKVIADLPGIIAVTEKEAAVCFRFVEGRMDYAGFYGRDPFFVGWAKDVFLHYWEQGKRL